MHVRLIFITEGLLVKLYMKTKTLIGGGMEVDLTTLTENSEEKARPG